MGKSRPGGDQNWTEGDCTTTFSYMSGNRYFAQQRKFDPDDPLATVTSLGSAASALLAALFAHPAPAASVSELAAASKVATATAARTVDRLVAAGLVTDERSGRERLLRFNPDHLCARAVQDLLWISHGALHHQPTDRPPPGRGTRWGALEVKDWEVKDLIPPCLQARSWSARPPVSIEPDVVGPPAGQVRALVAELRALRLPVRNLWWLQEAYLRWRIGHDNDALHSVLHQGAGLDQAIAVLVEAAGSTPASTTIAASVWAHAIYAINAEATIAAGVAERATILIEDAEQQQIAAQHLREATVEVLMRERHRSRRGEAAPNLQPPSWPAPESTSPPVRRARDDPGAAFERVLLVQCEATIETMTARAAEMSAHPSFAAWLQANPSDPDRPHPVLTG